VNKEIRVRLVLVVNKLGRVVFVLNQPATPEICNAFLVARGTNDSNSVQVHGLLDDIGWWSSNLVNQERVPAKKDVMQEIF